MKKIVYLVIAMLLSGLLFAQNHDRYTITANGALVWHIHGTETVECDKPITTRESMTIFHWIKDTTGTDSTKVRLNFQLWGANGWFTLLTKVLEKDSLNWYWNLTSACIPCGEIARVTADGLEGNKQKDYSVLKLLYDGYPKK